MPALQQAFNASQYDPATGFTQLPVGEHPVVIVASTIEGNKGGTSGYVKFSVKAIDGPANGLSMDWRVNLYNASQKAAEIAHRQMSAICHAVGVPQFNQTEELHGKPFVVVVTPQKEEPEKYNEISSCKYIDGSQIKPGQYGVAGGGQAGGFGGQPAQGQQQQPQGAWGGAPAQGQPQQQQQQQQQPAQGGAAWGGQPANGQPAQGQQGGNPAWGGGQQAQGQQQPAQNGGGQAWGQNAQGAGQKPAWG